MFQVLKKRLKNEKGLSLVELLAVIVILGIVAAIAVPAIGNIIENSRSKAVVADAVNVMNAANMYFIEESVKDGESVEISKLKEEGFLESEGKLKSAEVTKKAEGNSITFSAEVKGEEKSYTATLAQLSNAKVSGGEITIDTSSNPDPVDGE